MNVQLVFLLCVALFLSSSCGQTQTGSDEDEAPTNEYEDDDYHTVASDYDYTFTPDYDYTATFDYYYVTEIFDVRNKGSVNGGLTPVLLLGLAVLQMCH